MAVFPSSLPCVTEFRLTPAGQRADADPPGYSQRRNRTRSGWALADVEWFFLQSQLDTFEDFFRDDIYRGAAWFLMVLPITPEATGSPTQTCYSVVRFPEGYSTPVLHRQGYWRVRARIEIRDRFECALAQCDPYWDNVILLLHGGGSEGSSLIVDSSPYLDDKTAPAGLTITTAESKFGGSSMKCVYTNIGDFVWAADRFIRASGVPFTIEYWFKKVSAINTTSSPLIHRHQVTGTVISQLSQYSTGDTVQFIHGVTSESPVGYVGGEWNHAALTYDASNNQTLFINGTQIQTAAAGGGGSNGLFYVLGFGSQDTQAVEFYLDELRVTNGVNRYPANFTPPTAAFPNMGCG
jgi:hypothetical protein